MNIRRQSTVRFNPLSVLAAGRIGYVSVGPAESWERPLYEGTARELTFHFCGKGKSQITIRPPLELSVKVIDDGGAEAVVSPLDGSVKLTCTSDTDRPLRVEVLARRGGAHKMSFSLSPANMAIRPQEIVFVVPEVESKITQEAAQMLAYTHQCCRRDAFVILLKNFLNSSMTVAAQQKLLQALFIGGYLNCAVDVLVWLHSTNSPLLNNFCQTTVWNGMPVAHALLIAGNPALAVHMSRDSQTATAELLALAAQCCDVESVKHILPHVVGPSRFAGETPLGFAITMVWVEVVQMLVENGCNVNEMTRRRTTPLLDALEVENSDDRLKILSLLLATRRITFDVSSPELGDVAAMNGQALFTCLRRGWVGEVSMLIQFRVPMVDPTTGEPPLRCILQSSGSEDSIIQMITLLRRRFPESINPCASHPNIEARKSYLQLAIKSGLAEVVRTLLKIEPKALFVADAQRNTPLHEALMLDDHTATGRILPILYESVKGNVLSIMSMPGKGGNTAMHTICERPNINESAFSTIFISWKGPPYVTNESSQTPLHVLLLNDGISDAARTRLASTIVTVLETREKEFAKKDLTMGFNVFHLALDRGYYDIADRLLATSPICQEYLLCRTLQKHSVLSLAIRSPSTKPTYDVSSAERLSITRLVQRLLTDHKEVMTMPVNEPLLHMAAVRGYHEIITILLRENVVAVSAMPDYGWHVVCAALAPPLPIVPSNDLPVRVRHSPAHERIIMNVLRALDTSAIKSYLMRVEYALVDEPSHGPPTPTGSGHHLHEFDLSDIPIARSGTRTHHLTPLQLACHFGLCDVIDFIWSRMTEEELSILSTDLNVILPLNLFVRNLVQELPSLVGPSTPPLGPLSQTVGGGKDTLTLSPRSKARRLESKQRILHPLITRYGMVMWPHERAALLKLMAELGFSELVRCINADSAFHDAMAGAVDPTNNPGLTYPHFILLQKGIELERRTDMVGDILRTNPMVRIDTMHQTYGTLLHVAMSVGAVELFHYIVGTMKADVNAHSDDVPHPLEYAMKYLDHLPPSTLVNYIETLISTDRILRELVHFDTYTTVAKLRAPRLFYLLFNYRFPLPLLENGDTFVHMLARVHYKAASEIQSSLVFAMDTLHIDLNTVNGRHCTPLMMACEEGNLVMVRELLNYNMKLEIKNFYEECALQITLRTVTDNARAEAIGLLLLSRQQYVQLHNKCSDATGGTTAVHLMCTRRLRKLLETALDKSGFVDLNIPDAYGRTPLHYLIRDVPSMSEDAIWIARRMAHGRVQLGKGPPLLPRLVEHVCPSFALVVMQCVLADQSMAALVNTIHDKIDDVPLPFVLIDRITPETCEDDVKAVSSMLALMLGTGAIKPNLSYCGMSIVTAAASRGMTDAVDRLIRMGANPNNRSSQCLVPVLDAIFSEQYVLSTMTATALRIVTDPSFDITAYGYLEHIFNSAFTESNKESVLNILKSLVKHYTPQYDVARPMTALHSCISSNVSSDVRSAYVEILLRSLHVDVNSEYHPTNDTPLLLAIKQKAWDVVMTLTQSSRIELSFRDPLHTALHVARGDPDASGALFQLMDVLDERFQLRNIPTSSTGHLPSLFMLAAERGDAVMVRKLLGKDCIAQDVFEASRALVMLMDASSDEDKMVEVAMVLFSVAGRGIANRPEHGVKLPQGLQCLHKACANGFFKLARYLVQQGFRASDETAYDAEGYTPFHRAFDFHGPDKVELCAMLLRESRGFRVDLEDATGKVPLMHAAAEGMLDVVKELLRRGAEVDVADISGTTALLHALEGEGDARLCRLLVSPFTAQSQRTRDNVAALHIAARRNMHNIIPMLVDCGATVDCEDSGGRIPLHYCLANKEPGPDKELTLQRLLEAHQEQDVVDKFCVEDITAVSGISSAAVLVALLPHFGHRCTTWIEERCPTFLPQRNADEIVARVEKYNVLCKKDIVLPSNPKPRPTSELSVDLFNDVVEGCGAQQLLENSSHIARTYFFYRVTKCMTLAHDVQELCDQHAYAVTNLSPVLTITIFRLLGSNYTSHVFMNTPRMSYESVQLCCVTVAFFGSQPAMLRCILPHVDATDGVIARCIVDYGHAALVGVLLQNIKPEQRGLIVPFFFIRLGALVDGVPPMADDASLEVFNTMLNQRVPLHDPRVHEFIRRHNLMSKINMFGDSLVHLAAMSDAPALLKGMRFGDVPDSRQTNCFTRSAIEYCESDEMRQAVRALERSAQHNQAVEILRRSYKKKSKPPSSPRKEKQSFFAPAPPPSGPRSKNGPSTSQEGFRRQKK
eukprot:PhM_4_TR2475/c0_g1_i1/m.70434